MLAPTTLSQRVAAAIHNGYQCHSQYLAESDMLLLLLTAEDGLRDFRIAAPDGSQQVRYSPCFVQCQTHT